MGTSGVVLLSMQVWLSAERGDMVARRKERMMESSVQMENSGLSGLQVCPLESCRASNQLRKIIVPVDLTRDCPTSIDYAICFAKAYRSTLNLLYLYQEPYVVDQSFRSRGCDLFREQRRKVFADFYKLLRETRNRYPDSIGYFEYGNPEREIDVIARRLRADLIIVSVQDGNWLEHLLFGRHAEWILANAPCPVLVIREGKTDLIGRTTTRPLTECRTHPSLSCGG
jgi:nucleotide-binding universal stress UspA family protein